MLRLALIGGRLAASQLACCVRQAATALGEKPGRLMLAQALVLPTALATWWAIPQVTWVISPSINAWAVRARPGMIRRGDLVSFMLSHPLAGPLPVSVTKYALCMPGDRLVMIERTSATTGARYGRFYCNGCLIAVSKPHGRAGQRLTPYRPAGGVVPDGSIFVGSGHADGFDSRYYGPVAIERLTRMERVL